MRTKKSAKDDLRKFIYHPVVLASVDHRDFGGAAVQARPVRGNEDDCKTVSAVISLSASDFESPVRTTRKKLFKFFRTLRVTHAIAQQNHARLKVVGLPGVQETIGGCQGEDVVGIRRRRRTRAMFVRPHPRSGQGQKQDRNPHGDLQAWRIPIR